MRIRSKIYVFAEDKFQTLPRLVDNAARILCILITISILQLVITYGVTRFNLIRCSGKIIVMNVM